MTLETFLILWFLAGWAMVAGGIFWEQVARFREETHRHVPEIWSVPAWFPPGGDGASSL